MNSTSDARSSSTPYTIPYEKVLNDPQLKAVMFNDGPILVIAGAGSGKTRTLTYRVARLVENGISPKSILLLTFTRKASMEMLGRASRLLDRRCEKVAGGTFHSFANTVLRRYARAVGFDTNYSIMDRADSLSLIGLVKKELNLSSKKGGFPRNQTLMNIFSRSVNKAITIEDIIFDDFSHFYESVDAIMAIFDGYQSHKARHNFFDYDDLLVYLHRLLSDHADVRNSISSTFNYIMVDEYQDTNLLQAEIMYLLSNASNNVMAVGDDSQSIYAFRGANFENIMEFPNIFPGTIVIGLEENYRSVQPILSLTNTIIAQAEEKYDKRLFTRKEGGRLPSLIDTGSENNQSLFVVDKIKEIARAGISLDNIAVLFRAGFHSFDLEIELSREMIPFIKVGGFKFMESAHIKDLLSHIRLICNPYDRISWYRILLLLERVGPKTAHTIYEEIARQKTGYTGILELKNKSAKIPGLNALSELFAHIDSIQMSVAEMGAAVLRYYHPILKRKYDDHPKRLKDLEQLLVIMERYHDLEEFLTDMALEPPNNSIDEGLTDDVGNKERLVLSTIHSAKGLEWHTVFIIWALDGRFPSLHALDSKEDLEEELRLMYVAATRARENLFIAYPSQIYDKASGLYLGRPSRFVADIADTVLERISLNQW